MLDRPIRLAAVVLVTLPLFAAVARGATITVSSDTVTRQHEEQATLCVSLVTRASEQVAGTENELTWDGDCASMLDGSCVATGSHGKNLSGTLQRQRDFTYKGLVLSFTDTDPIPSGQLYCCTFLVHANPGSCCRIRVTNPGGSDPEGNALPVDAGPAADLCVASNGSGGSGGSDGSGGSGGAGGLPGGGGGGQPLGDPIGGAPGGGQPLGNPAGGGAPGGGGGGGVVGGDGGNTVLSGDDLGGDVVDDPNPAPVADDSAAPAPGRAAAPQAGADPDVDARVPPQQAMPANPAAPPAAAAPTPAVTPAAAAAAGAPADAPAAPAAAEPTTQAEPGSTAPPVDEQGEDPGAAAGEEKPSPRDVARAQGSGGAARPRRMPLDDEEGWFGCQVTRLGPSALPALAPLVVLLLMRRRRRI